MYMPTWSMKEEEGHDELGLAHIFMLKTLGPADNRPNLPGAENLRSLSSAMKLKTSQPGKLR